MTMKLTPKETRLTKGVTEKARQRVFITFPEESCMNRFDRPGSELKNYANSVSFTGAEEVKKLEKEVQKKKDNINYLINSVNHQKITRGPGAGYSTAYNIPYAVNDLKKTQAKLDQVKRN